MDDEELWDAYAWPDRCLRANFVTTIDGHIQGPDGLSGTLSSAEDRRVFHMLRAGADAMLVGAGTARTEKYKAPSDQAQVARVCAARQSHRSWLSSRRAGTYPISKGRWSWTVRISAALKDQLPAHPVRGRATPVHRTAAAGPDRPTRAGASHRRLGGTGSLLTAQRHCRRDPEARPHDADGVFTLWGIHVIAPMLAKAVGDQVPDTPGLLYEPKWDGFRCVIFRDDGSVVLQSRKQEDFCYLFPEVVAAAEQLAARHHPRRRARDRRRQGPGVRSAEQPHPAAVRGRGLEDQGPLRGDAGPVRGLRHPAPRR